MRDSSRVHRRDFAAALVVLIALKGAPELGQMDTPIPAFDSPPPPNYPRPNQSGWMACRPSCGQAAGALHFSSRSSNGSVSSQW